MVDNLLITGEFQSFIPAPINTDIHHFAFLEVVDIIPIDNIWTNIPFTFGVPIDENMM
jgi:hypothetical protein